MGFPKTEELRDLLGALAGAAYGPGHEKLQAKLEKLHREVEDRDPHDTVAATRRLLPQVAKLNSDGARAVHRFVTRLD